MLPLSDTYNPSKNYRIPHISVRMTLSEQWTYLSDILIPYPADLLDVGRALRDILQRVSGEL